MKCRDVNVTCAWWLAGAWSKSLEPGSCRKREGREGGGESLPGEDKVECDCQSFSVLSATALQESGCHSRVTRSGATVSERRCSGTECKEGQKRGN